MNILFYLIFLIVIASCGAQTRHEIVHKGRSHHDVTISIDLLKSCDRVTDENEKDDCIYKVSELIELLAKHGKEEKND
jgi:hypothetical protein